MSPNPPPSQPLARLVNESCTLLNWISDETLKDALEQMAGALILVALLWIALSDKDKRVARIVQVSTALAIALGCGLVTYATVNWWMTKVGCAPILPGWATRAVGS